jgi:acetylornithine deacetylase/succinyl-diaminopimelate desuccinylase-like protein
LQVKLRAQGTTFPLPPGLATSVRNPLWRLTWALAEIKGSDEDIRINGFYDNVEGPGRDERAILRQVQLDEHGRLAAWNMSEFLFGMTGSALVRTEVTLPTCNLSSFTTEPPNAMFSIPTAATARLDFHLVPYQRPDEVMDMLRKHLVDRGFEDIEIERLPGGYAPIHQAISLPFVQHLSRAGEQVYGTPLSVLPFGTFTHPFAIFFHHLKTPVASLGFGRHTSSEYGPNEHLPIEDLVHHGQMLIELMVTGHESAREVAFVQPQPGPVVESQ